MSEEEKRAIRAAALLEYEETKAHLALLRAKAEQWHALHDRVTRLLAVAPREFGHVEKLAEEARAVILRERASIAPVMDLDAILDLDAEIERTLARLKKASEAKKALGFQ